MRGRPSLSFQGCFLWTACIHTAGTITASACKEELDDLGQDINRLQQQIIDGTASEGKIKLLTQYVALERVLQQGQCSQGYPIECMHATPLAAALLGSGSSLQPCSLVV
jgi:hypothetical protein